MRPRLQVVLVAVVLVAAIHPAAASAACLPRSSPPQVGLKLVERKDLSQRSTLYAFHSKAVGPDATPNGLVHARVTLPQGYRRHPARRYPVLFDYHGTGGDATSIPIDIYERIIARRKVIFVSPDGGPKGFYSDWYGSDETGPNPPPAWESFHIRELLPWVDETFRTNQIRGTVGGSMGGFGAISYAARNPELFVSAGAISGALDTQLLAPAFSYALTTLYHPCIWGDPISQSDVWAQHNPTALAPQLKGISLYVSSGNGLPGIHDEPLPDPPESALLETAILRMNQNFVAALDRAGIPVTTWFYGNGTHAYGPGHSNQEYFYDSMRRYLPQAMAAFRDAAQKVAQKT